MLLEKSSGKRLWFSLTVSELAVTLRYSRPGSSVPLAVNFRTEGRISPHRWTHLALQVTHLMGFEEHDSRKVPLFNVMQLVFQGDVTKRASAKCSMIT